MERNIKRSKSLRTWHKYKKLILLLGVVFVVLIGAVVGIVKAVNNNGIIDEHPEGIEVETDEDGNLVPVDDEDKNETEPEADTSTEATTEEPTTEEPTTEEPTTEEPTTTAPQEIVKSPKEEEFSQESFYTDAVFVGDAFVEGIDTYQYLESKQLIYDRNWTTGKASANGLSKIESSGAKKVILEIGINDLNTGKSGDKVFDSYKEFVTEIKGKLPNAKIYVVSVFPVTSGFEAKETVSIKNDEVAKLNELLEGLEGVTFIDVNKSISDDDGDLMDDLSSSGLNIKNAYYGFILNLIAEMGQ